MQVWVTRKSRKKIDRRAQGVKKEAAPKSRALKREEWWEDKMEGIGKSHLSGGLYELKQEGK